MDDFQAVMLRRQEWQEIDRRLNALYQRQHNGDRGELTRTRIAPGWKRSKHA
ncbi:hypothetical protein AB0M31_34165 [Streptomyces sp. NPDC051773]|uniref:hypothetical protein n=1 Tax=Streptomyces sp. NPDC051773 TaxID=3156682 RepID=UPI00342E47C5